MMPDRLRPVLFLLLLLPDAGCSRDPLGPVPEEPEAGDLLVLFLGSSLTYTYNMPGVFRTLSGSGEKPVFVQQSAEANYTVFEHLADPMTLDAIASRPWDVVVLQDASYKVAFSNLIWELVAPYQQLKQLVAASNPDGNILLNMFFPPLDGDTLGGVHYSFDTLQDAIHEGVLALADSLGFGVVPTGVAWQAVMADGTVNLFGADRSHPSYAGAYLQSLLHYAAIFLESPEGLADPTDPGAGLGAYLKGVAADVVLTDPTRWYLDTLSIPFKVIRSLSE